MDTATRERLIAKAVAVSRAAWRAFAEDQTYSTYIAWRETERRIYSAWGNEDRDMEAAQRWITKDPGRQFCGLKQ